MPYLYLISSVFLAAATNVFGAFFNRKNKGGKDATAFYNLLLCSAAFVCWLVYFFFDFNFSWKVLPYSILFGASYVLSNIAYIKASKIGPASLSALFISFALLGVSVWGFIFWDAPVTTLGIIGIVLVACSVVFCLYEKKTDEDKKFSWKWLFWALMAFVGNAGCSIVQRTQQMKMNNQHAGAFMVFALLFSVLTNLFLWIKEDKSECKQVFKRLGAFPIAAGAGNFLLNLFVILLAATTLSPTLIYPVIGVGALIVTMGFSVSVLKEKLKWWQWLGIMIGAVAIVLLSL